MSKSVRCSSCNALIRWIRMPSGKLMPVNSIRDMRGTVLVHDDGQTGRILTRAEREALPPGADVYLPHWATCPLAHQHQR